MDELATSAPKEPAPPVDEIGTSEPNGTTLSAEEAATLTSKETNSSVDDKLSTSTPVRYDKSWIRNQSEDNSSSSICNRIAEVAKVETRQDTPVTAFKNLWIRQKSEKVVDGAKAKKENVEVETRRAPAVSALKDSWIRTKSDKSVDEVCATKEPDPPAVHLASRSIPFEEEADGGDNIVKDTRRVETL